MRSRSARLTDSDRLQLRIAVASAAPPTIDSVLRGSGIPVDVVRTSAGGARALVRTGDADGALLAAPVRLVIPSTPTSASLAARLLMERAAGVASGEVAEAPAIQRVDARRDRVDILGADRLKLLVVLLYLVANLSLVLVPLLISEEIERGTIEALLLAATPGDIGAAKALVGLGATGVMVALTVNLGDVTPHDSGVFLAGIGLLAAALLPFGLAAGIALRTTARVSTLMGVVVIAALAPVAVLAVHLPAVLRVAAQIAPTGLAARLLADGLSGRLLYGSPAAACAGLLIWALAGFALLAAQMRNRSAHQ